MTDPVSHLSSLPRVREVPGRLFIRGYTGARCVGLAHGLQGEVLERFNRRDLKSRVVREGDRGFESHPLRSSPDGSAGAPYRRPGRFRRKHRLLSHTSALAVESERTRLCSRQKIPR